MNCPSCATPNPSDALYCNQCGEPLTVSALGRQRRIEIREKKTREIELTEAVAERLIKWVKWLGSACTVLVIAFGFALGKGYFDIQKDISNAQTQIHDSVTSGTGEIRSSIESAKADISDAKRQLPTITRDIQMLNSDLGKYKEVNLRIEKLQSDFLRLQTDVVDLGHRTLKAESMETTGPGGAMESFGQVGCDQPKAKGFPFSICAQGSPLALTSVTGGGRTRPVASFSEIGFQDVSKSPRPMCNDERRGTFYVEKGSGNQADKPFLCVKSAAGSYNWAQLAITN
jgi:hypothetical protein